jgi:hypothetical protein
MVHSIPTNFPKSNVFDYSHGLLRVRLEHRIRLLLWSYLWLLVLEGAVRKWVPGFSAAFLLVRDPIALAIGWYGAKLGIGSRLVWNVFCIYAALITVLGLLQIVAGENTFLIFLYGWRSYVLHIPVIIVAQHFWRGDELHKVLKWFLSLSIPMTMLMCLQYVAPASSFLNAGAQGEGSSQLEGALGHIRPAGTFSFITGPSTFYPLVAAICFYGFFFSRRPFNRNLLMFASGAVLLAIPISVSRTLALSVGIVIVCGFIAALIRSATEQSGAILPKILYGVVVFFFLTVALAQTSLAKDAIETFVARWTSAAGDEGATVTLSERVLSTVTSPLGLAADVPLIGGGIGAGSVAASFLRSGDNTVFIFGEGSLEREFTELGLIFGSFFLLFRLTCAVLYAVISLKDLRRGTVLSWLLILPACSSIFLAQLDQATAQGFLVVTIGLALGSLPRSEDRRELSVQHV